MPAVGVVDAITAPRPRAPLQELQLPDELRVVEPIEAALGEERLSLQDARLLSMSALM